MVAVLEHELVVVAVGDDHGRRLRAVLHLVLQVVDVVAPVVLVDGHQHRVAGRPGQAVELVERSATGPIQVRGGWVRAWASGALSLPGLARKSATKRSSSSRSAARRAAATVKG